MISGYEGPQAVPGRLSDLVKVRYDDEKTSRVNVDQGIFLCFKVENRLIIFKNSASTALICP